MYEQILVGLQREIEIEGARPSFVDIAVNELLTAADTRLPRDLLMLLSDRARYDDGMFSLIHAAESVDDSSYVRALIAVFPDIVASAPRWASIVLMRVLNNQTTQSELVKQLRDCSSEVKASVQEMCRRINEVSPQFLSKTLPVTLAAS
ncbi:MAG: Imm30 family immunity protein [Paracoccaceae bacterium]